MPNNTHKRITSQRELQDMLSARLSSRGDLPGFSKSVQAIVSLIDDTEDEAHGDVKLIQVVLADASLTQRVLKLANSPMYAAFGGHVSTVSRAIVILGTQTVAHLALGLKVIESFKGDKPGTHAVQQEMQKCTLSGILGRQFAHYSASARDSEEASVCAVLHGTGRMLVAYYLPEYWAEIARLQSRGMPESDACQQVLCASFETIGQLLATSWGLPLKVVSALRKWPDQGSLPASHDEWLCAVGTVATQSAHILYRSSGSDAAPAELVELLTSTAAALGADPAQLLAAAMDAKDMVAEMQAQAKSSAPATAQRCGIALAAGLRELRAAAVTSTVSQVVSLALEFLNQSLGCSRSFSFTRAPKEGCFKARMGLGAGASELVSSLRFDMQFKPDLFHVAMAGDKVLYVRDAQAENIRARAPLWWQATLSSAKSFCVVPMRLADSPAGFLYFEWAGSDSLEKLDAKELEVLAQVREVLAQSIEAARTAAQATKEMAAA